jgi:hypothetical protein
VSQVQPLFLRELRGSFLRGLRVEPALFGSREGREGAKTAKGKSLAIALITSTLLCQATVAPAEESNTSDDIVVIARRLNSWSGKFSVRGDKVKCATKKSTGDNEIDAIGCSAMAQCLPPLQPRITASDNSALDKAARISMKESIKRDLTTCVKETRADLIAELARRRAIAK